MADTQYEYTEQDWAEAGAHRPLKGADVNQVFLLHRHWIWAHLQRSRFEELLPESKSPEEDPAFMASEWCSAMFLWYSLLWSVIEGFEDRGLEVKGRMAEDIAQISDTLRQFRNAVFHVSKKNQHDPRLFGLMQDPDNVARVCRISTGFGRIFIEEQAARKAEGKLND
jgi:hypothetical protein